MAMPRFIGNHGLSGSRGNSREGVGIAGQPSQAGGGAMTGKAGDVGYIQMSSLRTEPSSTKTVYFQSEVPVEAAYTMCNVAQATSPDPATQEATLWTNVQEIAAGVIVAAGVPCFTVVRITFKGDGTLYLGDG